MQNLNQDGKVVYAAKDGKYGKVFAALGALIEVTKVYEVGIKVIDAKCD
jgi:hypothetical protein